MNKNKKLMFLAVALVTVLILVTSVNATNDNTNTSITKSISEKTTTAEPVVKEKIENTQTKEKVDKSKEITKTNKTKENTKTATNTVTVNNMDELTTSITNAVNDIQYDEYVINLNDGNYEAVIVQWNRGTSTPNITINMNDQVLSGMLFIVNSGSNITFNDGTIATQLQNNGNTVYFNNITFNEILVNSAGRNTTIVNSTINSSIDNNGILILGDDVIFTDNFRIDGNGQIISNDMNKLVPYMSVYNGDYVIENMNLTSSKRNNGKLRIENSNLTGLTNNGNLTANNSQIITLTHSNNAITLLNNTIISNRLQFNSNITIINSVLNQVSGSSQNSYATIINSTLNGSTNLMFNSFLIIDDNCVFGENFMVTGNGRVIYNDSTKIAPYLSTYYDEYTLENTTISSSKTNNGNLTIKNSTINSSISNYGNLTIADNVLFGENTVIYGNGAIIINDTRRISPYMSTYNGEYTLENTNIKSSKTNNGNLTIKNSIINSSITNNGNLTISDDTIFGENAVITNNGNIIINDTNKIIPYLNKYDVNYTIRDSVISTAKTNTGNLTIINTTLNSRITNNGTLIISDNCILGNNFAITAQENHNIISNITNISSYITSFQGNHTLENTTTTKAITVTYRTNLTIKNSLINSSISNNNGNIFFENSTINGGINNLDSSTITLADDVKLGENFAYNSRGTAILNASYERYPYFSRMYNGTFENMNITKTINCYNMTIINSTINAAIRLYNSTIINSTCSQIIYVYEDLESNIINSSLNYRMTTYAGSITNIKNTFLNLNLLTNNGIIIIDDDSIIGDNLDLRGNGEIIINDTNKIAPYINEYYGNILLKDKTINGDKTNQENLTIENCTITGKITNNGNTILNNSIIQANIINNGILYIDENTVLSEGIMIEGNGIIITDNITRLLPHLQTINGNHTISETNLTKSYRFIGNITLENCNITAGNNVNYGLLNVIDSTINVSSNYNRWIENNGILFVKNSTIINGEINNYGEIYYETLPETINPRIHIVNQNTAPIYSGGLPDFVQPGDTLDFRGTITSVKGFKIDKPVNIITSTNDGRLEDLNDMRYTNGASGSNVTGLTLYNSQFYVMNASNILFNNISNIVDGKGVGQGVGQTSIRAGSENITIQNSYIYTRNNGGSSSLVLANANYCNLINNTVVGGGGNGNLIYLTTYGANIPEDGIVNHHNKILNNTIIGPDEASGICVGFVVAGSHNLFDGNTIYSAGEGVAIQYGSGVIDDYDANTLVITNNTISNNKFYNGSGISGGNIIYNNYIEKGTLTVSNGEAYNNTVYNLAVGLGNSKIFNNTVLNTLSAPYSQTNTSEVKNNNIKDIAISRNAANITFTQNNITGTVNINGTNNVFTENNITSTSDYAFIGRGTNNTITNNYITSAFNGGDASVDLNQERNTIKDNTPISTIIGIADDLRINIYETETITFNITNSNNEIINKGNIIIKDETGNTLLEQTVNGEEINLDLYYEEQGAIMLTAQYTDETGEHLNATKTIRVVKLVPPTQTQISDETPVLGESTELTATFFQVDGTPVNGGKAIFRVNGKTIRDDQGNVIYADVINGHVQPLTVNVTSEWMNPGTTIQAIYSGTDEFEPIMTQPTTVNVTRPEATITLDAPTTATAGSKITLKATVTDGDKEINSGRVAFKLNGKTLKDPETGKALYANVENGVATIPYTIPTKTKAQEYILNAVFTDTLYDRKDANATLTVVKS